MCQEKYVILSDGSQSCFIVNAGIIKQQMLIEFYVLK